MQGIHRKERENRKRKTHLTHTGLLMEGVGKKVVPPQPKRGIIPSLGVENESLRAPSEQGSQESLEAKAEEAPHRTTTTASTPQ
jgi:hypothetical protein